MNKKIIAFYLPQYHTIPENDNWWGKGFTEWVRVQLSKPVFKGHNQPREPLEYYDLSDVSVMVNQAKLAKDYGLYGFCYYHYWFNGKLLLEKPLENMLASKDVNIPFCLSWANEPWTRAWEGKSKQILMHQEYGEDDDWLKHLEYLLPFFKDDRYIKVDGKPMLLIYRAESFSRFDEMILLWDNQLKRFGFNGIYITEMLTRYQKEPTCLNSKAVVEFEPMFTIGRTFQSFVEGFIRRRIPWILSKSYSVRSYDKIWNRILRRKNKNFGKTLFLGAFTNWDNTPRFKTKSLIFLNSTPEKFKNYLLQQLDKSENEFLFVNAWNEWAEGAYLEPDKNFGYGYLEAIKSATKIDSNLN